MAVAATTFFQGIVTCPLAGGASPAVAHNIVNLAGVAVVPSIVWAVPRLIEQTAVATIAFTITTTTTTILCTTSAATTADVVFDVYALYFPGFAGEPQQLLNTTSIGALLGVSAQTAAEVKQILVTNGLTTNRHTLVASGAIAAGSTVALSLLTDFSIIHDADAYVLACDNPFVHMTRAGDVLTLTNDDTVSVQHATVVGTRIHSIGR